MNPIITSSNSYNHSIIETHRFLCHIITAVTYFSLKAKIYPKKVPVVTNNELMQAASSISIYAFKDINFIILLYLYLTWSGAFPGKKST